MTLIRLFMRSFSTQLGSRIYASQYANKLSVHCLVARVGCELIDLKSYTQNFDFLIDLKIYILLSRIPL